MIPLSDINPTRRVPIMNLLLIGANILVFVFELQLSDNRLMQFISTWGILPRELVFAISHPLAPGAFHAYLTLITSQFVHAGWAHIVGNMLFLFIFGDNVEDVLGSLGYLAFYLICGIVAGLVQSFVLVPLLGNVEVPSIGASGAIAGVLGAYLVLYPRARVRVWIPIFLFLVTEIPAFVMIGLWFVEQFLAGVGTLTASAAQSGGVAFWAHVGGFVSGMAMILPFWGKARQLKVAPRYVAHYQDSNRW